MTPGWANNIENFINDNHSIIDLWHMHLGLTEGERLAVDFKIRVCRQNFSGLRACVVGSGSLAWVKAAYNWGADIQAVASTNSQLLTIS